MGHPQFGGDVTFEAWHESLQQLLNNAPSNVPSSSARLLMIEEYHKQFGIASHEDVERPLSLVAMHASEDPISGSLLVERLKEFADLDIHRIFGIGIDKYLELPHDMCELLVETARPRRQAEQAAAEKGIRDLANNLPGKL